MKALITGITGQDGSYLAELLLEKNYKVIGMVRRSSTLTTERIEHIIDKIELVPGDLLDQSSIDDIIKTHKPDEVYNLAAQSFVSSSWKMPIFTADVTGLGTLRVLEAIRRIKPDTKFYQASTSEMFGKVRETPQNEYTPFYPRSPYGVAKTFAHYITINYRESYNLFASCGILFNHESPRRGLEFVTRKISDGVARIYNGLDEKLLLGNLDSKRDWGFAGDYVDAMWKIIQYNEPDTFVVGTDETHSVREFCDIAFSHVGLNYRNFVKVDPKFFRPAEVDLLISNSGKVRDTLDWKPKVSFEELVKLMVDKDLERITNDKRRKTL